MKIKFKIVYKDSKPSLTGEGLEFNKIDKNWDEIERVIFWVNDILNIYTLDISQPCTLIKRWEQSFTLNKITKPKIIYWYVIKLQNGLEINLKLDRIEI